MTRSQQQRVPHRAWRPVRNDKIVGVYAALKRRSSTVARASVDGLRPSGAKAHFETIVNRSAEALRRPKALDGGSEVVSFPSFLKNSGGRTAGSSSGLAPVRNDRAVR